jgi:2-amino-4-hydroxy-6-hydroxymethyldihydropteridine diphosphokinase
VRVRAVIGVGGNLGDRWANIDRAIDRLEQLPGVRSIKQSQWFETEPVGPPQPMFLNGAVLVEMDEMSPIALVDLLLAIERDLGRVRNERNGPRTIDLDVLWTDGAASSDPRAVVPHPRLAQRAFALAPLVDLVPDARDSRGVLYAEHLARLGMVGVRAVSRPGPKNDTA